MEDAIDYFRSQKIPVFTPGEEDYERSVATANLLFRYSRPGCVVQPENTSHVRQIVTEANAYSLNITIKCGGHSYAGYSTARDGISLDLRRMNKVKLDMVKEEVSIEAGAQWGNVYKTLLNGGYNGWVINGGRCPLVGTSGFILGGGLGPFSRTHGMGSDTLLEASIVTADGKLVTVTREDMEKRRDTDKGKLFWALCGAGGGNFGVLVKIKMKVLKLRGKRVVAGRYTWFPKFIEADKKGEDTKKKEEDAKKKDEEIQEKDFLETMTSFYSADWPQEMTIDSTWICDLREKTPFGVRYLDYFDGDKEKFDKIVKEHLKGSAVSDKLAKQIIRRSLEENSTRFLHETLVLQWSEETKRAFPTNRTYTIYSSFVFENDKTTFQKVTGLIREEMKTFARKYEGEKVEFLVSFIHAGSATTQGKAAAFPWRSAVYQAYITIEWEDKWMELDMRGFMRRFKKKFGEFALSVDDDASSPATSTVATSTPATSTPATPKAAPAKAAYINFADGSLKPREYEMSYYGKNYEELRKIKAIWDKEHFFKWQHGVNLPGVKFPEEEEYSVDQARDDLDDLLDMIETDKISEEDWKSFEMGDFMDDLMKIIELPK